MTNQPTQPDMFEPPEKFGNYLAEKSLAAFNQPTDATPYCSCGDALDSSATCPNCLASLSLQLATLQAQAKLMEEWGERISEVLEDAKCHLKTLDISTASRVVLNCGKEGLLRHNNAVSSVTAAAYWDYPQPIDASSLARIARVALVAYKFMHAEKSTNCGIDFWSEFVDAYNAIQPNDIALAQALAGGA